MGNMGNRKSVLIEKLIVNSLAQTDALAKLLVGKDIITQEELSNEDRRRTGDVSADAQSNATLSHAYR
jgi:hypothetical protein